MGELRQPSFLLLLGSARADAGDRERHRLYAHRDPRAAPAQLFVEDQLGQEVEALAAVLLGDERGRAQAEAVRLFDDLVRKFLGLVEMRRDRADLFLGEPVRKLADLLLLGREREVQCQPPPPVPLPEGEGATASSMRSILRHRLGEHRLAVLVKAFTSSLPSPTCSALKVTLSPGT